MKTAGVTEGGRIELDVDWIMLSETGRYFISCADNGDGMTRSELERYTTHLAVQGAGRNQSLRGNQGMGLKISGPTKHKKGVLLRSLKKGERTMVQIGWRDEELGYDLIPVGKDGEVVAPAPLVTFPKFVLNQGSGTIVTFLGKTDDAQTFLGETKGWLFKYSILDFSAFPTTASRSTSASRAANFQSGRGRENRRMPASANSEVSLST